MHERCLTSAAHQLRTSTADTASAAARAAEAVAALLDEIAKPGQTDIPYRVLVAAGHAGEAIAAHLNTTTGRNER